MSTFAAPANQKLRINTLRVTFLALLPLLFIAAPIWTHHVWFPVVEIAGEALIIAAVLGRFWCILYIGGHKNRTVMRQGPYSLCRHPLYFFSTLGVVGFAVLLGSIPLALTLGTLTFLILWITAAREEAYLRATFGSAYCDYARNTPAIWPSLRLFHTASEVSFSPRVLRTNLMDGLVFLAFIPLARLIHSLHDYGMVPSLPIW